MVAIAGLHEEQCHQRADKGTDARVEEVSARIEGEEEVGSSNLATFVKNNKSRLAADVVLISGAAVQYRYGTDHEYPFRQESNFQYLTGVWEPDFKLLLDVAAAELDKLDFFEELDSGLYLRHKVRVQSSGQWLDAWCYLAGPLLLPYLAGDWSVEHVSAQHKDYLITQLIPSMLTTYHNLHADTGTKTKAAPLSED